MSQSSSGISTFTAGAALSKHARVKVSSSKLAAAGVGTTDELLEVGTLQDEAFADGDIRSVRLRNDPGVHKMIASAAIGEGVAVYGAAAGKIATTVSGAILGVSKEASAADGDIIGVVRV